MYSLLYLEVSNFWNDLSVGSNITRKRFQSDGNGLVVLLAMFESCLTRLRYILYFIASSVFFGAVLNLKASTGSTSHVRVTESQSMIM